MRGRAARSERAGKAVLLVLVAAFLLASLPVAAAQTAATVAPVLVEPDPATPLATTFSHANDIRFAFNVTSLNADTPFYVSIVGGKGLERWTVDAVPNKFFAPPRNGTTTTTTLVVVRLVLTNGAVPERTDGNILIHVTDTRSGATTETSEAVAFDVQEGAKVLGLFANPLPSPLDNEFGVFLLDVVFWTLIGLAVLVTSDSVVRYVTRTAKTEVTKVILHKLRRPIFLLILLLGLRQSVAVLPESGVTDFARNILAVIAVAVLGLYVVYKGLDSALYYYGAEIAPRTETKIDDVLVPALRKISIVILVIFGFGYSVRTLFGLDLTFLVAGAGIAGLVLAFAAQDTLSNFFSGIFLLLDQPFAEGDDIMIETGEICRVDRIGLRSTRLYHHQNHERIVLPNNQLASKRIVNLSAPDPRYRLLMNIGVAYGSDPNQVRRILIDVAKNTPGSVVEPGYDTLAFFKELADSNLLFEWRVYISHWRERNKMRGELLTGAYRALNAAGIEIPFPQRTVWLKTAGDAAPPAPAKPDTQKR
ncbi:MAG: mechanosensitive ion channel family protein [Thermoplasmatota archaeon]